MKKLLLAFPAVALVAACGGNVVVDGAASGTGGTSSTGSTTTSATTLPTGGCLDAPPPGSLTLCGGSSGSPTLCSFSYCDQNGGSYTANCTGNTCKCFQGANVICTCALTSAGNFCAGTPDCCFSASL